MKIHFVYAFQPGTNRLDSPFCITNHLHAYFSKRAEVTYDVWDSHKTPKSDPEAIFIGHPHYDTSTIVQNVFRHDVEYKARCSIHPFHHQRKQDNMPFDHITAAADKVFSICGPYWYETIDKTDFAHWKPKMVRVDMAVDTSHFPYLRQKFNPVGKRKLVYIGSSMPQKNLAYMTEVMSSMPDVKLKWYGGDGGHPLARLPNVEVTGWVRLDKNTAQSIVNECDIFINTSISDANPTTLLEARAWGLITACTPQSGYYKDEFFTELPLNNMPGVCSRIRLLLQEDEEVLLDRARRSRQEIETKYTWERFCRTIWNELEALDAAPSNG